MMSVRWHISLSPCEGVGDCMALRIFVSHATQDAAFAERLADDLRRTGADVWLDLTHIGPGPFPQRISKAINASDVLVLVLTLDAINSQ